MGNFYHMIDAMGIWNAIKARFGGNAESKKMQKSLLKQKFEEFKIFEEEGLDKVYDKMQKILSQMNTLKIKPKPKDVNIKFLRGLPPSWSGIALILKTKGGLKYISFDDLYNKLKFLEIDSKGYSSSSSTLSNAAFVSTARSSQGKLSYQESGNDGYGGYTTTLSASPGSLSSKGSSKSKCSVEYDLKHQMEMLSIKVHRFEKKHGRKIKFNGRENARFDKKLVKCFNCKKTGHFSRECRAQGGQNSNNYQKYKKAGKDGTDSKAMVVVDGSIDWDKQTEEGNTEPRSLENFGIVAGLEIASDADSEREVVSADDAIPAGVFVSAGDVFLLSDELEGQPIYNRFALVDHMKAVPPPLTWNYMPPSNIPDIDESQMVYGKKATDSFEIKTNNDSISYSHDSVLFDFNDRSSKPSTNGFQTCDSSQECSRPNHSNHDSNDSISSVSAPAGESRDTIVIDCDKQKDFPSVCSIETNVKSSKPLCNKFGSFNKESHFRKHKYVASKSCYVCGSYLHLIKDYDLHEQRFTKRNVKGKGILKSRPTGKPVNPNRSKPVSVGRPKPVFAGRPNPVSADQPNPVSAGQPNKVSASDGILGLRPLNIQPKSTYFHSFTNNNQQIIFLITHNSLYSLYMTGGLNGKTAVKPQRWFLFTFAGRMPFCWLFPIPADDLVSTGYILFLLVMYALTANPTINASLVRQFWGSASEVSLPDGEPALVQAQPQEVSHPPSSPVVEPHPSIDPMPSSPRQSSPSPIPFGPAPSSGVVSTEPIPDKPSSSRPSEPVLETITSPIRDDDTGGGSFHESPPSPPPATPTRSPIVGVAEEPLTLTSLLALFPTCLASTTPSKPVNQEQSSEQEISPATLDAVLTLSQSKTRARAAKIIYKRLK
nr:hypothetical protein [Tanacetum cinerariifolium]